MASEEVMPGTASAATEECTTSTSTPTPTDPEPEPEVPKPTPQQVAQLVLDEHEARVFRPALRHITARDMEIPESFFEPTSGELSSAARSYTEASDRMHNAVMKTAKMRKMEEEARMSRFKKTLIRIQLPDRHILQGVFQPKTTVRQLTRFVRAALADAKHVDFHFFVVPPKRKLTDPNATLWTEGLVPAAIVHMGVDKSPSGTDAGALLKAVLMDGVQDMPEIARIEEAERERKRLAESAGSTLGSEGKESTEEEDGMVKNKKEVMKEGSEKLKKKIPKWFKK